MKKLFMTGVILLAFSVSASAGLLDRGVAYEDLALLSEEALNSLKETEFAVFLAEVKHAAARVEEEQAEKALKKAKERLNREKLNVKAAKAEIEAAKAKQEKDRLEKAEGDMQSAQEGLKTAEMLVKWKEKEVDVRETRVKQGKLSLAAIEIKRDLARLSQLAAEKKLAARKYSQPDFEKKLRKLQEDMKKAVEKGKRERMEADKLRARYEKAAGEKK